MFHLAFEYRFEAAHRFTKSCAESCATPHGHSWRARLELESVSDKLDEADMVVEFARLKKSWKALVDGTLDHSFFAHFEDPILPALREHIPALRELLFPGDPTTELLAALLFCKAMRFVEEEGLDGRVRVAAVHVQETETNSVRCDHLPFWLEGGVVNGCDGWWTEGDPAARGCTPADSLDD